MFFNEKMKKMLTKNNPKINYSKKLFNYRE